jgi:hypothetical protein
MPGLRMIGDMSARETPDSRAVKLAAKSGTVTYRYAGSMAALEAFAGPIRVNEVWTDAGSGETRGWVLDVDLVPEAGGIGRLAVTCSSLAEGADDDGTAPVKARWETDNARLEKPLLSHPKITAAERANLTLWAASRSADFKFTNAAGAEATLTDAEQDWARKLLAGVESYLFFAPVSPSLREPTHGQRCLTS